MERTKFLLIIILLVLSVLNLNADNKSEICNAYVFNRMPVWKSIIDQLNSQPVRLNKLLLELVNYQYGYIEWCLSCDQKEEALAYLKLADENVKILEEKKFDPSQINAYKSAFYGYHIALNKFSAPFTGPKSAACAKRAILLDPDNYFGYIQSGNVKLHTPSLMGGSKSEAIAFFLKAKALIERKGDTVLHGDWNYLSLLKTIAKAYESADDYKKAKLMYEEILRFEPEFKSVKDDLYPKLLKKL